MLSRLPLCLWAGESSNSYGLTLTGSWKSRLFKPNEVVAYYLDRATGQELQWRMTSEFSRLSDILWAAFRA
jgi:hypothetical protein